MPSSGDKDVGICVPVRVASDPSHAANLYQWLEGIFSLSIIFFAHLQKQHRDYILCMPTTCSSFTVHMHDSHVNIPCKHKIMLLALAPNKRNGIAFNDSNVQ